MRNNSRRVEEQEIPTIQDVIIPLYEKPGIPPETLSAPLRRTSPRFYHQDDFKARGNPDGHRQQWLAKRILDLRSSLQSDVIPYVFRARDDTGALSIFWIDKGAAKFLENRFAQFIPDPQGYVTALRLLPNFLMTYGGGGTSDNDRTLHDELVRLTGSIKSSIARAGLPRDGLFPVRTLPSDVEVLDMVKARWREQRGNCALCDRPVPLKPKNRLLQMSPDRVDSVNKAYDWRNTKIAHLACNLGKNDATVADWGEYLTMLRSPFASDPELAE